MNIEFVDYHNIGDILEKPVPAISILPSWYKDMPVYINGEVAGVDESGNENQTMKKCLPCFDVMTSGYVFLLQEDIDVSIVNGTQVFSSTGFGKILSHSGDQAPSHPMLSEVNYSPRLPNYWGVITPKGYSSLVMPVAHRVFPFQALTAIIDTDTFNGPIHFPCTIEDKSWEGRIPAGTPIAQIIPFKRDSWTHSFASTKEISKVHDENEKFMAGPLNRYKKFKWHRKEYR
jgi:hypothetical protein